MDDGNVTLPALLGGQEQSWLALIELAEAFGEHWLLVGGQMVFMHEVQRGAVEVRPTDDVDVVVNLLAEPAGLVRVHEVLVNAGFAQDAPSPDGAAHRYRRRLALIDILAPDNLGSRAGLTLGAGRTVEAPGTTQAFRRSSLVQVRLGDESAMIRRPDLVGALIGKASAVVKITSQPAASRAKHVRDFDSLAQLLGPADRAGAALSKGERRLLSRLDDGDDLSNLGAAALRALVGHDTSDR